MVSNGWSRLVVVVGLLGAVALGCDGGGPAGPEGNDGQDVGGRADALVAGRKATVSVWTQQGPGEGELQTVADFSDPNWMSSVASPGENLSWHLFYGCAIENLIRTRIVVSQPAQTGTGSAAQKCSEVDGPIGADTDGGHREQLIAACIGQWALALADAASPLYSLQISDTLFMGTGTTRSSIPAAYLPLFSSTATPVVRLSAMPRDASERATWALVAVDAFRVASTMGAKLFDPTLCPVGGLDYVYEAPDGSRFDLKQNIAATTADSLQGMIEASTKAREYLHAAAKATHATGKDPQLGRVHAWRDAYDSLLRASSAYVKVPRSLYEPDSYCEVFPDAAGCATKPQSCLANLTGADEAACEKTYPVVTALSQSSRDRRAEDLLLSHRIDPRVSPTRSLDQIANELLIAVNAEYRGAYTNFLQSGTSAGTIFLQRTGITKEDLDLAAKRIVQSAKVLGKPIVAAEEANRDYDGDGALTSPGESEPVQRTGDLSKSTVPVNPWYLYAITETAEWPLTAAEGNGDLYSLTPGYAARGVFHALDYFRQVHRQHVVSNTSLDAEARTILDSAAAFAGTYVRGTLAVSSCTFCSPNDLRGEASEQVGVRIRMDDAPGGLSSVERVAWYRSVYDVWLGEAGLRCALEGLDELGNPCDPREYRFNEEDPASVLTSGSDILMRQWPAYAPCAKGTADRTNPASTACTRPNPYGTDDAPLSPRLYVTERRCGADIGRASDTDCVARLLGGYTVRPNTRVPVSGSNVAGFSIPVGPGIEDALMASLAADPTSPDDAAYECGDSGMNRNVKLGLESELSQSLGGLGENSLRRAGLTISSLRTKRPRKPTCWVTSLSRRALPWTCARKTRVRSSRPSVVA